MELEPELAAQLKRVLSSLETLLPRPVPRIDWSECVAANWRKRSLLGVPRTDRKRRGPSPGGSARHRGAETGG